MNSAPAPQSRFVTVLAWVMIAFGIFSVLMGLLQSVFMSMLMPALEAGMPGARSADALPVAFLQTWMLAALALSVFMTYAAYALLKRRNWARIFHVALFIFTAVLLVVMAAALAFGFSLVILPLAGVEHLSPELQSAIRIAAIVCAILMLAMGVVYIWLARRLLAPAIAAEFGVPSRPAV